MTNASEMHSPSPEIDVSRLLAEQDWLRRLARQLLGEDEADDLAQETLLVALRRAPAGLSPRRLRAWLAAVARRNSMHARRSRRNRRAREEDSARVEAQPDAAEALERASLRQFLVDEVMDLDASLRDALVLRHFEGFTYSEVAARLSIRPAAARTRVSRGVAALRERLDRRSGGDRTAWSATLAPIAGVLRAPAPAVVHAWTPAIAIALIVVVTGVLASLVLTDLPRSAGPETVEPTGGTGSVAHVDSDGPGSDALPAPETSGGRRAPADARPGAVGEAVPSGPTVTILATVADDTGAPIEGIELVAVSVVGTPSAFSGADGEIALAVPVEDLRAVAPQVCRFGVRAPGWESARTTLGVDAVGEVFLGHFQLVPAGTLVGRVVDHVGDPVVGATVFACDPVTEWSESLRQQRRIHGARARCEPATTDAGGRYRLEGVPLTSVSVLARAPRTYFSTSEPIQVVRGDPKPVAELVLEEVGPESRVEGVVLDREGAARPGMVVKLLTADGDASFGSCRSDSRGAFAFIAEPGGVFQVMAGRTGHDPVFAYDVQAGTTDLVLRQRERAVFVVRARAADGRPLRGLGGNARFENGAMAPGSFGTSEDDETLELLLPERPFHVQVHAHGYAPFRAGPFDPESPPEEVEAVLVPLTGITGVVSAAGSGLEGAFVDACAIRGDSRVHKLRSGLHDRFRGPRFAASTDPEGRFVLALNAASLVENGFDVLLLHATAPGYGHGPMRRLELVAGGALPDVALEVGGVGHVEGQVVGPAELDLRGHVIAISQADGRVQHRPLDREGRFRFDDLSTGRWQAVAGPADEVLDDPRGVAGSTAADEIPWSFEVAAGVTTRFDLALEAEPEARVRFSGRFQLDGAPPVGWRWRIARRGELVEGEFDAEGRFEAQFAESGPRTLSLLSPRAGMCGAAMLDIELEMAEGVNAWNHDLATGALLVRGPEPPLRDPEAQARRYELGSWQAVWRDEDRGATWRCWVHCAPESGLRLPQVPVGTVTFAWSERGALVEGTEIDVDVGARATSEIELRR